MLSIFNNARRTSAWNKHKLGDVLIFFDNLRKPLSSIQREKMAHIYPYYGAASIVDYVEDYLFDGAYILISEDGANVIDSFGHPLTQYTYEKFWVNNHAHIVKGSNGYSEALVYAMLGNAKYAKHCYRCCSAQNSTRQILRKFLKQFLTLEK